ncbi:GTPase activating protein [Novymonas esmeraldas]|uniref:GTPase activating protein n=1 Tax=Novymonas esmeraldas TaxID=1808958 RepID=A0AAW0F816_9TRYP
MPSTAADLRTITGLTEARAKECFDAFGSYAAALASFAQSFSSLPTDYFQDAALARINAQKINDELRAIYRIARELKTKSGKSDAEVWKMYPAEQQAAAAPAPKSAFGTAPPAKPFSGASAAAFPGSGTNGASKFSFGAFTQSAQPTAPQTAVLGEAPKSIFGAAAPASTVPAVPGSGTNGAPKFGFGNVAAPSTSQASVLGETPKSIFGAAAPASTTPVVPGSGSNGAPKIGFGNVAAPSTSQASVLGETPKSIFGAAAPASTTPAVPSSGSNSAPKIGFGNVAAPSTSQASVLGETPKSIVGAAAPASTAPAVPGSGTNGAPKFGFGSAAAPSTPPAQQASVLGEAAKSALGASTPVSAVASTATNAGLKFDFGSTAASSTPPTPRTSVLGEAPAAPISFGFGAKVETTTTPSSVAPVAGFGAAATAETAATPASESKPVKYCEPTHFTGPYLDMPLFWEAEVVGRASLLNLNNGFVEAHKDELRPRLEKWVEKAAFYKKPLRYVEIEDEDEGVVRVIIKDADRTFFHTDHRRKLVAFLHAMYHEFHAYGQAMSYLAGLCMLVLTEDETAAVIRFVATEYLKGHWAAEAVGFATSAWVVEHFMQQKQPEVASHLEALKFWPDTYLQKILTGLCIHVLQFRELFDFLDAFMQGGLRFLIRFCLAIVEHFRTPLLAIKNSTEANALYELMRLDSRVADREDVLAILRRAPSIDLGEDGNSIDLIRSKVYEKHIEPRLERAPKTEAFEPCDVCEKNRPTWWNEHVGAVCDSCKTTLPDSDFEKY